MISAERLDLKNLISKRPPLPGRREILECVVLLGLLLTPPSALNAETVRLQLKWEHQFQFAGYYAAQEKGYYKAVGLDVEILPSQPDKDPTQQVIQGQAEFGVGTTDLLLLREQGAPVVALAVIFQHSPLALMELKQDGAQSIHDLAGSQITLEPGSAELQAYLNKEGITSDKFTLADHQFNTEALLNGTVKAMSVYVTDEPFDLKKAQMDYLLYSPRAVGIDFYGDTLFTTEQQLNQNPETVVAFRKASLKGWDYAMRHPEELAQLIHSRYSQRHSLEHLRFEASQMAPLMQIDLVQIGHMNPGRWRHIADTYAELGLMEPEFDLAGFLYNPHPPQPDLSRLYRIISITSAAALFILALAIYIYQLNRRLRRDNRTITTTQDSLRESKEKYEALYNNAPLSYQSLDENGCFKDINPAWLATLGYERKEVIGSWFGDFLHPDYKPHFEKNFPAFKTCRSVSDVQYKIRHKNGTYRTIAFEGCAGYHPDGSFKQTYCVFQDITERHAAEEALAESEQRFRRATEDSPFPTMIYSEDGTVLEISHSWCEITGYTKDELSTIDAWTQLAYGEQHAVIKAYIDNLFDLDERKQEGDYTIRTKNGDLRVWEFSSAPLGKRSNGQRLVISMAMDVTEHRNAELKLQTHNKELETFNKASVGRELRMIELKNEINVLCRKWDEPERYP